MDTETPVLSGFLNVPTQSGFSLNRMSKKKSCQRYCLLFKASRHGIERLELCESKDDKNPKIFTLENCVKITQQPSPANLIQIVKKTGTLTLNTLNDVDLKTWINALQSVAFSDKSGTREHIAIEEDNDLYCSSFGDGLFIVTLNPSDTSIRCNIEPKSYMLRLTATDLQLKSAEDLNVLVASWPYRFIRKYGYRDGKFTFEAGRKCKTGEGTFILDHTNPQEVFRCMSSKMKSMKKLINGEILNKSDCSESQLSVVASMEARSRSPLTPSPCSNSFSDLEGNWNQNCIPLRGFISSSDSLNNYSSNSRSNCLPQSHLIKKFPIKSLHKLPSNMEKAAVEILNAIDIQSANSGKCNKIKKLTSYEPVAITTSFDPNKTAGSAVILNHHPPLHKPYSLDLPIRTEPPNTIADRNYESIEAITNAWKTLGVSDIKHTERCATSLNDDCINTLSSRDLSHREKNSLKDLSSTKIIDIDIGEGEKCTSHEEKDSNYDRLDFFSPNNRASSGYKTIVTLSTPINATGMCCDPLGNNDYELVASSEFHSYRQTYDSNFGHSIMRNSLTTASAPVSNTNSSSSQSDDKIPIMAANEQTTLQRKTANVRRESSPELRNYNDLDYTIVSKPKRV